MRLGHVTLCPALVAALLALLSSAAPARATGYWNVPSSFCQCIGCGFGAGYHAQLVLGPISCENVCDHNEVRLPHAPSPPCYGYSDCDCNFAEPLQFAPPQTPPAPAAPASTRAIFGPPVEP